MVGFVRFITKRNIRATILSTTGAIDRRVDRADRLANNNYRRRERTRREERLTGHWHRFHVGHRAHSSHRPGESFLDLLERTASRLWHADDYKHESDYHDRAEHPEGPVRPDHRDDVLVRFRDDERASPIEGRGDACRRATYLDRQDLAHHQPRDRAESQGEADHVNDQTDQWYPAERRHVRSGRLHVEERAEREQSHAHGYATYVQQHFSAQFVYNRRRDERRDEVHDTDDDGGEVLVNAASSILKNN